MAFHPSKRKRHRKVFSKDGLMLTPLVDIFVCLLLFLLQSYSSSQEVIVSDDHFQLPVSAARQEPHMAVTVKVNQDVIVLDDKAIVSTQQVIQQPDLMIEPLYQGLMKQAGRSRFIASRNSSVKFSGEVIIQGDREIPFLLLKKIMYTCSRAEFGNIALAVLQKEM